MDSSSPDAPLLKFEISTPLGFSVRTTETYWYTLIQKHPDLDQNLTALQAALRDPDEVRLSQRDPNIFLFYRGLKPQRWVVAVTRRLNGEGFLITGYQTNAIKQGTMVWPK